MKIVFLDFGGVLSCWDCKTRFEIVGGIAFCGGAINSLHQIIEAFGKDEVGVVVTSWERRLKNVDELASMLKKAGFKYSDRVVGKTPTLMSNHREREIGRWLVTCEYDVDGFVILEDEHGMDAFQDHWVRVCSVEGLTAKDAERAVQILIGGLKESVCTLIAQRRVV